MLDPLNRLRSVSAIKWQEKRHRNEWIDYVCLYGVREKRRAEAVGIVVSRRITPFALMALLGLSGW